MLTFFTVVDKITCYSDVREQVLNFINIYVVPCRMKSLSQNHGPWTCEGRILLTRSMTNSPSPTIK